MIINYIKKRHDSKRSPISKIIMMLLDGCCVVAAYLATLYFRFGGLVPAHFLHTFWNSIAFIVLIYWLMNWLFRLYSSPWDQASIEEAIGAACSSIVSTVLCYVLAAIRNDRMPRSIYIAAGLIIILLIAGSRLSFRVFRRLKKSNLFALNAVPVLIIGAGEAGALIVRQMRESAHINLLPACVVDDDPANRGTYVHGVRVRGTTADIPTLVKRYGVMQIIYAVPATDASTRRHVLELCASTGCELKIIPSVETMLRGKGDIRFMRDVDVGDLLERPIVKLDTAAVQGYLRGTVVLVTGGGGSIGSELCRQIALFEPKQIIVFDIYENNAYELHTAMQQQYGDALDFRVVIGSVRDRDRLDEVFAQYHPDVVFHAAAHKHVPLMEDSPIEAIKNNVNGTFNTAMAAHLSGVKRFVLISTDKAVNPTNVMGATKYLCELIVQYMNQYSDRTDYVAVRFGNVLGSNGSVVPLFRRQIAAGGPVTVTHKDVTRYFMTIPEAAQLVIQAGSMAKQGEIFLLDMGNPVRIDDFARSFIRLSGLEPDVDIKIEYTGLRPGEKIFEELLQQDEQAKSGFPGILIGKTHVVTADEIKRRIEYLREMAVEDPEHIRRYIAEVVPTYQEQDPVPAEAKPARQDATA